MMTYWTRIDHGMAVGVRNGRGRFLRRHSDVNSRRLLRCLRSLAGKFAKHSLRTLALACAWFKCGSRISARRWRNFSGRPKRSPDPIKSQRRSEGRKVHTAITVSGLFHLISSELYREFKCYFLIYAWLFLNSWSWNTFLNLNVKFWKRYCFYTLLSFSD